MTSHRIFWLVDDDNDEADDYKNLLERAGKPDLDIEVILAYPTIADYAPLLNDERTGGFILDQRMNDYRAASYSGLELASYIRSLNPKIPLFILTNYEKGLDEQGGSVEQIIPKPRVNKSPQTYAARLLRRLGEYEAALSQEEKRFKELIDKKLAGTLLAKEAKELDALRVQVERPGALNADAEERRWAKELEDQKQVLTQLERALNVINKIDSKQQSQKRARKKTSSRKK